MTLRPSVHRQELAAVRKFASRRAKKAGEIGGVIMGWSKAENPENPSLVTKHRAEASLAKPLVSHQVIVQRIAATTVKTGQWNYTISPKPNALQQ